MDEKKTVDGRIAKDPELRQGAKKEFCRFSLAVDRETEDDGTAWYNVTAFGALARLADARLEKGMEVRVKGRLQVREYTKNDGSVGTSNDIIADSITLEGGIKLDKFTPADAVKAQTQQDVDPDPSSPAGSEDIPF
jgi:single stranded DNA-binding protein